MQISSISPSKVKELSYTDFVGLINQWNVPPGSLSTISKWAIFSNLNEKSHILEVACTTGFSSRELALSSGCSGVGIDISGASVEAAIYNKDIYAQAINIDYKNIDAYEFSSEKKFSHVVLGAALKFFPDPFRLLNHLQTMMTDNSYFLATPFYIHTPIPSDLIENFKRVFGIAPTTEGYKDIMRVYKGLEITYQDHMDIYLETNEELQHYCESTVSRVLSEQKCSNDELFSECFARLLEIKTMSNALRTYQKYTTLVLRYRKSTFPHRYIELF